jgi:DNA (cytosine-5)-methyltransferase 1
MPTLWKDLSKIADYPAHLEACWLEHLAPRKKNAPTVISTFAGAGGSSLGYSMAGYRELLAVEWDDNAVQTFKMNFHDVPVYHGDIAKLSVDECLRMAGIKAGELDVFDGSPPCQGFSTAGKRMMDDPRNQLFREYVRLLRGLQPKVFVMENVSGMVKGKMKLVFAEILRELRASGYKVSARLLNAMWFGVPQSRERMIFIGVREDLPAVPSHPIAECAPIPFMNMHNADVSDWLTDAEIVSIETHAKEQARKGNSFKYQVIKNGMPAPTFSKTLVRKGSAALVLVREGGQLRLPSADEHKCAASFPLRFTFVGIRADSWQRIGNSVPPLFMRSIARHIRREILSKT